MSGHTNNQVVFALTTSGNDIFATMTRIAIASLRLSNPRMDIVVACDAASLAALREARHPLLLEADRWLDIETPPGNPSYRNRHVKTNLRATVEGSFLFLDSDVFVRGPLEQLFEIETDVAAAPNYSQNIFHAQLPRQDAEMIASLGWQVDPELYVNGGVILYKDTDQAQRFAGAWHERWKHSSRVLRHYRDQPALNAALHEVRPRVHVLAHDYNFQIKWHSGRGAKPTVWHYNHTSRDELQTPFESYADAVHRGSPLDMRQIAELAALDWPRAERGKQHNERKDFG